MCKYLFWEKQDNLIILAYEWGDLQNKELIWFLIPNDKIPNNFEDRNGRKESSGILASLV